MDELEAMFPQLEPGGRFHPRDCRARHKVAIVIPYRDREEHLVIFLNNIHPILQRQQLDYGIYVVEEVRLKSLIMKEIILIEFSSRSHRNVCYFIPVSLQVLTVDIL